MTKEVAGSALTRPEFEGLLVNPSFVNRVRMIANFTLRKSMEGGFAVYKNAGKIKVSKALTPDVEKLKERRLADRNIIPPGIPPRSSYWGAEYNDFEARELTVSRNGTFRTDLVLLAHSHTQRSFDNPRWQYQNLAPSPHDLDTYVSLQDKLPGIVFSIFVPSRVLREAGVFFWKVADGEEFRPTYLQTLDNPGIVTTYRAMANAGLRHAEVHYDLKSGALIENPQEASGGLFG